MSFITATTRAASRTEVASRSRDCPPADFDASAHPIIARHFFGIEPFRSIGEVAADVVADLRFRRKVQRLHNLGPRAVGELLAEVGAERGVQTIIEQKLDRYAEIDPDALEAAGGDKFWPAPVRNIVNGRGARASTS